MTKKELWNLFVPALLMLAVVGFAFLPTHLILKGFYEQEWKSDHEKLTSWITAIETGHADVTPKKTANALRFARLASDMQHRHALALEELTSTMGWTALVSVVIQIGLVLQLKKKLARRFSLSELSNGSENKKAGANAPAS